MRLSHNHLYLAYCIVKCLPQAIGQQETNYETEIENADTMKEGMKTMQENHQVLDQEHNREGPNIDQEQNDVPPPVLEREENEGEAFAGAIAEEIPDEERRQRENKLGWQEEIPPAENRQENKLLQALRRLGVITEMHESGMGDAVSRKNLPENYKFNSRAIRLQVLAGFTDSDGSYHNRGYVFTQEEGSHGTLFHDMVWLARSLGFCIN